MDRSRSGDGPRIPCVVPLPSVPTGSHADKNKIAYRDDRMPGGFEDKGKVHEATPFREEIHRSRPRGHHRNGNDMLALPVSWD